MARSISRYRSYWSYSWFNRM